MSTVAPAVRPSPRAAAAVPGAHALPQVNLLPPEIRAGRRFHRVRAWLGVVLLVAVLVCGLLVVWATLALTGAETELAAAQDDNQRLLVEQSQYAEVPRVLGQLRETSDARAVGMSTEVLWKPYLSAVAASAPAGVSLDTFAFVPQLPAAAGLAPTEPLLAPYVGTLTFSARSLTLPDTSAWMEALAGVPGLSDPWFTSAQLAQENGITYFQLNGSVRVSDAAFAERFAAAEEPGSDG